MQQQARVIDVKRIHSCLDVVILNGRGMDRSCAIRLGPPRGLIGYFSFR